MLDFSIVGKIRLLNVQNIQNGLFMETMYVNKNMCCL